MTLLGRDPNTTEQSDDLIPFLFFTARRYASAVCCRRVSVRLSVRLF